MNPASSDYTSLEEKKKAMIIDKIIMLLLAIFIIVIALTLNKLSQGSTALVEDATLHLHYLLFL